MGFRRSFLVRFATGSVDLFFFRLRGSTEFGLQIFSARTGSLAVSTAILFFFRIETLT